MITMSTDPVSVKNAKRTKGSIQMNIFSLALIVRNCYSHFKDRQLAVFDAVGSPTCMTDSDLDSMLIVFLVL